jgi:uncharacterized protein YndB with AHSA1/START domain
VTHAETKHTLELATPSDREIVMTRVFDAPRGTVFDAFTTPELISQWLLGPDGWSMPVCDVDLRVGGTFRYVWRNDADGREFGLAGVYHEIMRPARILHSEKFEEPWYPGEARITSIFREQNGSTTFTMTILFESPEARDTALESGMERGVSASYDRLSNLFDRTTAPASSSSAHL